MATKKWMRELFEKVRQPQITAHLLAHLPELVDFGVIIGKQRFPVIYHYRHHETNRLYSVGKRVDGKRCQWHYGSQGNLVDGLDGVEQVLFMSRETYRLIKHCAEEKFPMWVFITDREKQALMVMERGIPACAISGDADSWKPEFNVLFRGAIVFLDMEDTKAGRKRYRVIKKQLKDITLEIIGQCP